MAKPNLAALLKQLDEARTQHGSVSEQRYLQLLNSAGRVDLEKMRRRSFVFTTYACFCAPFRLGNACCSWRTVCLLDLKSE